MEPHVIKQGDRLKEQNNLATPFQIILACLHSHKQCWIDSIVDKHKGQVASAPDLDLQRFTAIPPWIESQKNILTFLFFKDFQSLLQKYFRRKFSQWGVLEGLQSNLESWNLLALPVVYLKNGKDFSWLSASIHLQSPRSHCKNFMGVPP